MLPVNREVCNQKKLKTGTWMLFPEAEDCPLFFLQRNFEEILPVQGTLQRDWINSAEQMQKTASPLQNLPIDISICGGKGTDQISWKSRSFINSELAEHILYLLHAYRSFLSSSGNLPIASGEWG